jgi:hypothetical protein
VFNGQKIGFSHLTLAAADQPGQFEIRSDTAFALRFLGFDKRINLKAYDVVRDDLDLVRFRYEYVIDGSALVVTGERRGDTLAVEIDRAGKHERQLIDVRGPLYPQEATLFYPSLHGLSTGREYTYSVYSGELQKVTEVRQRVGEYETSRLFDGEAYKVETAMEGYRVETWISPRGAPLLEIAMNGVMISGLEDEARARNYLAAASVNKSEALVDFALVRTDKPLVEPRKIETLRIALSGATRSLPPPDAIQRCASEGPEIVCLVHTGSREDAAAQTGSDARYLASTSTVPARDRAIADLAARIVARTSEDRDRVRLLVAWIGDNVRLSPADVWSALDVLQKRAADCQGHTYLYAALARALGIPTRVVNGIVYSEELDGFLYHTWAESLVGGHWLAVDPTFGSVPADATHVKLVEGETLAELTPITDWIGRLKVRVIAAERGQ